jgi:hypothetical protein
MNHLWADGDYKTRRMGLQCDHKPGEPAAAGFGGIARWPAAASWRVQGA